mgnify:CR=1 FL=1
MHQDEVSFVFGQPIFMNIGYTNCSARGWAGFNPTCLGCVFNRREGAFARAVGRLWTSFASLGAPTSRAKLEEHGGNEEGEAEDGAAGGLSEWPRFGASGGRNVLLEPSARWVPGLPQVMHSEEAMGRRDACEVWDALAAAQGL